MALAGYVCPAQSGDDAMTARMASGAPCEGMDRAQPALCHQHGAAASLSFEAVKLPVATLPMVVQMVVLPTVLQAVDVVAVPVATAPEAQPPPDPIFLSTLRLRV